MSEAEMTVPQAAQFLGVKATTLRNWMCKQRGPRSFKRFGRVYFLKKDLEAFIRANVEVRAS